MWEETASAIDARIERRMGPTFHELCEDSRRCLRTQAVWSTIDQHLAVWLDGAPAINGVKALELELRRRVVTPDFLAAVRADLADGSYLEDVECRIRKQLGDQNADRLTLGQCVGILAGLLHLRLRDRSALNRSRVGAYLRRLDPGYTLVDSRFVNDLYRIVAIRNRLVHGATAMPNTAAFEVLLFGDRHEGLLPFLVRASRTRWAASSDS
jgi:hypothetical protein